MPDTSSTNRTNAIGTIAALFSAVAFGSLVPCSKLLLASMSPVQLAALLLLGAGVGTGCIVVVRTVLGKASSTRGFDGTDAPKLAAVVVLNALAVACLTYGFYYTVAENASLLMGFEIGAAVVFAWILFDRHVCAKAVAAVALICLATILLLWNTNGQPAFVPESLFIVVGCALRGLESGIKRSFADRDPFKLACLRSLGAGIILLAASFVISQGVQGIELQPAIGAIVFGFATFGIGASCHLVAQRNLGSARSEGYFALAPFLGMVASWALFGLTLEPLFFGALAFMALGVWLAMDDSVFHEDSFAAANENRIQLYMGGVDAWRVDFLHRPMP